jgi:hypothetical protein
MVPKVDSGHNDSLQESDIILTLSGKLIYESIRPGHSIRQRVTGCPDHLKTPGHSDRGGLSSTVAPCCTAHTMQSGSKLARSIRTLYISGRVSVFSRLAPTFTNIIALQIRGSPPRMQWPRTHQLPHPRQRHAHAGPGFLPPRGQEDPGQHVLPAERHEVRQSAVGWRR